jgi:hypothetical protein
MLLTKWRRLCCFNCIQAGYISCITPSQGPRHRELNSSSLQNLSDLDSSDFQNILDLDYAVNEWSITTPYLWGRWDRWRYHRPTDWRDNKRADYGNKYRCAAYGRDFKVDITEHTLNGKVFYMSVLV